MIEPTSHSKIPAHSASWVDRGLLASRGLLRSLLRLGFVCAGFVLMLGALLAGLLLVSSLVVWSLLRGRRPAAGVLRSAFERSRRRAAEAPGQVIDVEVREVPDPVLPRREH